MLKSVTYADTGTAVTAIPSSLEVYVAKSSELPDPVINAHGKMPSSSCGICDDTAWFGEFSVLENRICDAAKSVPSVLAPPEKFIVAPAPRVRPLKIT